MIKWTNIETLMKTLQSYSCMEINVVKVRFSMRYSSRTLSNKKFINHSLQLLNTNCLSFPGYEWKHFIIRQKIFEIPPFFQTRPEDLGKNVHACSLRFSALKAGAAFLRLLINRNWKLLNNKNYYNVIKFFLQMAFVT